MYRADQTSRLVAVLPETTAQQVVHVLQELDFISNASQYTLCEVSVVHGGLVKQTTLRETADNLATSARSASTLFVGNCCRDRSTYPYIHSLLQFVFERGLNHVA